MKTLKRRPDHAEEIAALAAEFGVDKVFDATEPYWYTRVTGRFRLTWRREAATVVVVFLAGAALGFLLAQA